MRTSDSRLDELLASSAPFEIRDEAAIRAAVARVVDGYPAREARARRPVIVASIVGGALVIGTTAAAVPSIFADFGSIDSRSSQEYTVDGRGPFRCDYVFRVDPPVDGRVLEPSDAGGPPYDEIVAFIRDHDWAFDDRPVALTTPSDAVAGRPNPDLGVMSDYIARSWQAEVAAAYPGWLASVGSITEAGQCLSVADGSAP